MSTFSLFAVIATIISLQSTCNGECGRFHGEPLDICTKHEVYYAETTCDDEGWMLVNIYKGNNGCEGSPFAKTWRTCLPEEGGCVCASGETCDYARAICPNANDYDKYIQTIIVLNECILIQPLDNNTLPFEAQITCSNRHNVDELAFELCGNSIGDPLPINDTSTLFNINDALGQGVGCSWECFGTLINTKQPSSSPSQMPSSPSQNPSLSPSQNPSSPPSQNPSSPPSQNPSSPSQNPSSSPSQNPTKISTVPSLTPAENGSHSAQIIPIMVHFLMIFSIFLF